jgi:hypothetical protein
VTINLFSLIVLWKCSDLLSGVIGPEGCPGLVSRSSLARVRVLMNSTRRKRWPTSPHQWRSLPVSWLMARVPSVYRPSVMPVLTPAFLELHKGAILEINMEIRV